MFKIILQKYLFLTLDIRNILSINIWLTLHISKTFIWKFSWITNLDLNYKKIIFLAKHNLFFPTLPWWENRIWSDQNLEVIFIRAWAEIVQHKMGQRKWSDKHQIDFLHVLDILHWIYSYLWFTPCTWSTPFVWLTPYALCLINSVRLINSLCPIDWLGLMMSLSN